MAFPALPSPAGAQAYPSRPVRIIVGYAAGGGTDIAARVMGHWLSERLGQQFIIENRPGAATNIATEAVARSAPDGYTLLLVTAANAINATYYEKLSFDFIQDIAPVGAVMRVPLVMVVNPSFPVKTVAELIAHAKANPRKISYASGGAGGPDHMAGRILQAGDRHRDAARALPRARARAHRPDRRPGAADVRHDAGGDRVHQGTTGCARSQSRPKRARRRCRTCRSWPMSCQASRRANGTRSAPRRAHPPTSSRVLNKAVLAGLADAKIRTRIAELGGVPMPMTPAELASSLPTKPGNGPRPSSSPAPR